jgi:CRP-like cAMP-binding protein
MNPLKAKFSRYVALERQDSDLLDGLLRADARLVPPGGDLIREGEPIHFVKVITDGWACRYKLLADGRRQIVAFLLPGDMCNPDALVVDEMDHSIGAITEMYCALIQPDVFDRACLASTRLRQAMAFDACAMLGMQREWTLNVGARPALERIAHMLCELHYRLAAIGLAVDGTFATPLTQIIMAEAAGITSVHVNRVVQDLRARGLLLWHGRSITLPDPDALAQLCGFSPRHLHMPRFALPGTQVGV